MNAAEIENIMSQVTGGSRLDILGSLPKAASLAWNNGLCFISIKCHATENRLVPTKHNCLSMVEAFCVECRTVSVIL